MSRLADDLREVAFRVPRRQARALFDLAAEADRMERALDELVANAAADARALAETEHHHG